MGGRSKIRHLLLSAAAVSALQTLGCGNSPAGPAAPDNTKCDPATSDSECNSNSMVNQNCRTMNVMQNGVPNYHAFTCTGPLDPGSTNLAACTCVKR